MRPTRNIVDKVATIDVPDPLPPAIVRPRQHVTAVLAQSLARLARTGARRWPGHGRSQAPARPRSHCPSRQAVRRPASRSSPRPMPTPKALPPRLVCRPTTATSSAKPAAS